MTPLYSNCELSEAARANGNNHSSFDDAESGGSVSDYAPSNVMYDLRHKSFKHRGKGISCILLKLTNQRVEMCFLKCIIR